MNGIHEGFSVAWENLSDARRLNARVPLRD